MRRLMALPIALVGLTIIAAGCRHDGRTLRPALPSQNGSVSTSSPSTTPSTDDNLFDTVAVHRASSTLSASASTTSISEAAGAAGGSTSVSNTVAALVPAISITAPWRDGGPIDARYTCKGQNVVPALSWTAAPEGTQEIAVTMIDQDFTFDHWTVAGIAPDVTALAENTTPSGAVAALNGSGTAGYTGPCPPAGATHTYRITVHFLNRALQLTAGGRAADMRAAIDAATFASAQVTGTFTGS